MCDLSRLVTAWVLGALGADQAVNGVRAYRLPDGITGVRHPVDAPVIGVNARQ